jgi:TetR/AcrR family transcriptional regulator
MNTEKFLSLEQEKRDRILNAALSEFTQKGYDNASTNEIVKGAGISKGLLFHYFKNKKELFFFLYDHFVEIIMEEMFFELDLTEKDIFTRLRNIILLKSQLMKKYPEIFNFMVAVQMEKSSEVVTELNHSNSKLLKENSAKLFDGIDTSRFREGLDVQRTINIILWTLEGFSNQALQKARVLNNANDRFEEAFAEVDLYIEMLRSSFYQ